MESDSWYNAFIRFWYLIAIRGWEGLLHCQFRKYSCEVINPFKETSWFKWRGLPSKAWSIWKVEWGASRSLISEEDCHPRHGVYEKWSEKQVKALIEGYEENGLCWSRIQKSRPKIFKIKNCIDLKDKFRNICAAITTRKVTSN